MITTDEEVEVFYLEKKKPAPVSCVISAGHGRHIRGAVGPEPWGLEEVFQARRVVADVARKMRKLGIDVIQYADNESTSQNENLERICEFHNSQPPHTYDISIHFNAAEPTDGMRGSEVFAISEMALAAEVSEAISVAAGFPDRGAKDGSGLYFCNHTNAGSLLVETAFVDARLDCDLYRENFDAITTAIAGAIILGGRDVADT